MRILIVEDHRPSAEALCKLLALKIKGAECLCAHTIEEGLRLAKQIKADITILDLQFSDSGPQETIRIIPLFPPPVIIVTDQDDPDHELELLCYANKAQNFFTKRFLRSIVFTHEGDKLAAEIIKCHWRNVLPTMSARMMHTHAVEEEAQHGH